jgi:hypothetical protein
MVRWGLLKHPYGREYARQQYTVTGRHEAETDSLERTSTPLSPRHRAALAGAVLLFSSLLAAGVLVVST